jgi:hypothetical protein
MDATTRNLELNNDRGGGLLAGIQVHHAEKSPYCSIHIMPRGEVEPSRLTQLGAQIDSAIPRIRITQQLYGPSGNYASTPAVTRTQSTVRPDGRLVVHHVLMSELDDVLANTLLLLAEKPAVSGGAPLTPPLLSSPELILASQKLGVAARVEALVKQRTPDFP